MRWIKLRLPPCLFSLILLTVSTAMLGAQGISESSGGLDSRYDADSRSSAGSSPDFSGWDDSRSSSGDAFDISDLIPDREAPPAYRNLPYPRREPRHVPPQPRRRHPPRRQTPHRQTPQNRAPSSADAGDDLPEPKVKAEANPLPPIGTMESGRYKTLQAGMADAGKNDGSQDPWAGDRNKDGEHSFEDIMHDPPPSRQPPSDASDKTERRRRPNDQKNDPFPDDQEEDDFAIPSDDNASSDRDRKTGKKRKKTEDESSRKTPREAAKEWRRSNPGIAGDRGGTDVRGDVPEKPPLQIEDSPTHSTDPDKTDSSGRIIEDRKSEEPSQELIFGWDDSAGKGEPNDAHDAADERDSFRRGGERAIAERPRPGAMQRPSGRSPRYGDRIRRDRNAVRDPRANRARRENRKAASSPPKASQNRRSEPPLGPGNFVERYEASVDPQERKEAREQLKSAAKKVGKEAAKALVDEGADAIIPGAKRILGPAGVASDLLESEEANVGHPADKAEVRLREARHTVADVENAIWQANNTTIYSSPQEKERRLDRLKEKLQNARDNLQQAKDSYKRAVEQRAAEMDQGFQ